MRIRTIKPEFFTHEGLFDLEKESRLPVRIAFAGLWCAADKCGRFKWEPRRLGVAILPYDSCDFSRVLDALTTRGFIVKYQVGDAWFGYIPSFERHQVINNREKDSDLPEPSPTDDSDACPTRAPRVDDACPTPLCNAQGEGKGKERKGTRKGKEGDAPAALPEVLDSPDFREAWTAFLEHRQQKRKPMTGMAAEMQIRSLAEMGKDRAIAAILHSIKNGWQGIFEPSHSPAKPTPHKGEYPENIPLLDLSSEINPQIQ